MLDEDPDINDLPTNKFYERLDDDDGIEVYYNDCPTVKSMYNDHSDHHKFCAIVVKNLKTLHNILNDNIPDDLLCPYWNYWVYDRAINKFKISDENIYYSDIITYIFYDLDIVNKSIPSHQRCSYTKHRINVEAFLKKKKNFDDTQNYENIKNIINSDNDKKYNNFFTYITNDEDLYSKIKKECLCNNEENFCVEFHKYNVEKGKEQLCSLKCDSVQSFTGIKETPKLVFYPIGIHDKTTNMEETRNI
ncbi:Plasmodium vivax Vir protein, putative [Plasmodium vivax]|uniref:Vir protein, putative n=1 Tax=Plasmodium vivax TaxID=5855 RepID=A0A1G4H7W7_PLAVI|nr:Plasmodium vivax Vir protein, putative [Plasmodium vivax]